MCCLPLRIGDLEIHANLNEGCGRLKSVIVAICSFQFDLDPVLKSSYDNDFGTFMQWMYEIQNGTTNGCRLASQFLEYKMNE